MAKGHQEVVERAHLEAMVEEVVDLLVKGMQVAGRARQARSQEEDDPTMSSDCN